MKNMRSENEVQKLVYLDLVIYIVKFVKEGMNVYISTSKLFFARANS